VRQRIALVLGFISLSTAAARAERLPLKPYTVADGLPHNVINRIVRDTRGFLWFSTAEGLALFDGYTFTTYGSDDGLLHPYVNDILETPEGIYWVATNGGLYRFNPKGERVGSWSTGETRSDGARDRMFTRIAASSQADGVSMQALVRGRDGTIWCGSVRGLFRLTTDGGRFGLAPVDLRPPNRSVVLVNSIIEDRAATLWIGTANGLYRRWGDGTSARYDVGDGLPYEYVHDVLEDRAGHLWVGTRERGLALLAPGPNHAPPKVLHVYNRSNGLGADWIFDLQETSDGTIWVGTNHGLAEFAPTRGEPRGPTRVYTERDGFLYHEIATLGEDGDGNLWLGTVHGAMRLVRNGFRTVAEQDGLYTASALYESSTGELYVDGYVLGDRRGPVFAAPHLDFRSIGDTFWPRIGRFDGQGFTWLLPEALDHVRPSWSMRHVVVARSGEWWIGTGDGVYRFPRVQAFGHLKTSKPLAVYTTRDGLASSQVFLLFEDASGNVWISTVSTVRNGLAVWQQSTDRVRDMSADGGLPSLDDRLPVSFSGDMAGNVWIGFNPDGLARYRDGRFQFFTSADGLPAGRINDLFLDHRGRLWIATSRGGVAWTDDPAHDHPVFGRLTTADGLSSNETRALTEDLDGRVYVGTGRGIDRIAPATRRVRHFSSADGVAAAEIQSAIRDRDGTLWFATTRGLSRFVPEPERETPPPSIRINGFRIAGRQLVASRLGETEIALHDALASDANDLEIDFVSVSFAPGETLRYQYRLGNTGAWSPLSEQRSVTFARLGPGRYTFFVRAANADGVVSTAPATVRFVVSPPVWQRWWFVTLVLVTVAAVASAIYRYRINRILELANVRTRIAVDLHDDIGSNLTKIAILSEVARQQPPGAAATVDDPLASIARIARESVASMSDIVWAINPQRDRLLNMVRRMRQHAEETLTARGIRLAFRAPADDLDLKLGIDVRRDIYLIFKEAINNAARHADCSRVEIDLSVAGSVLRLDIADNGRGVRAPMEHDGEGLASMRRRAARLGGSCDVRAIAGIGTTVEVRVSIGGTHARPT
jgi:ligand-binding sensor domain-containing protein/signal transduction histidine kinase